MREHFPEADIFQDIEAIHLGADFVQSIQQAIVSLHQGLTVIPITEPEPALVRRTVARALRRSLLAGLAPRPRCGWRPPRAVSRRWSSPPSRSGRKPRCRPTRASSRGASGSLPVADLTGTWRDVTNDETYELRQEGTTLLLRGRPIAVAAGAGEAAARGAEASSASPLRVVIAGRARATARTTTLELELELLSPSGPSRSAASRRHVSFCEVSCGLAAPARVNARRFRRGTGGSSR